VRVHGLNDFYFAFNSTSLQLEQRQHIDDTGFVLDSADPNGLVAILLRSPLIWQASPQQAFVVQCYLALAESVQCCAPIRGQSLVLLC
jgi:hypothetical protein